jgi:hypothetical protein
MGLSERALWQSQRFRDAQTQTQAHKVAEKAATFIHSREEFFSFIFVVILLSSTPISKRSFYDVTGFIINKKYTQNCMKPHMMIREQTKHIRKLKENGVF